MHHQVSVIVPVWNMARFLPDAIASIPDVHEILIAVAASDDDTLQSRASLRGGAPGSWCSTTPRRRPRPEGTSGFATRAATSSPSTTPTTSGRETSSSKQLARLDREPRVDVVGGRVTYFDKLDPDTLSPASDARLESGFTFRVPPTIFRRSVFDQIGVFDESPTMSKRSGPYPARHRGGCAFRHSECADALLSASWRLR